MKKFEITIGSLPNKDNLVADIFYDRFQVAEITNENNEFLIQLFFYENKDCWTFLLEDFQKVIEDAKRRLIEVG